MAPSAYSTVGMHRLSAYVQEGVSMFSNKLYLIVQETVLLIGTKCVLLDWKLIIISTLGYAKSILSSLGFFFEQKQS